MNYSEKIKTYRENLSLTQKDLAESIGCSRQIIVRWENGLSVPSLYHAQKKEEKFGTTVTELMSDGKAESEKKPETSVGQTKDAGGIKKKVGMICILSFIPLVLYNVFGLVTEAVRQYLILEGFNLATDYRKVTDLLERASAGICFLVIAVMFFLWINGLIACFLKNTDKYSRYLYFKNWNVGFFVLVVNIMVLAFYEFSTVTIWLILTYVCAISAAAVVDGIVVFFIRLFGKKRILFEKNPTLDRLDLIFFIIRVVQFTVLIALIIYAFAVSASAAPIAVLFYLLIFSFFSLVGEIIYVVVRTNLCAPFLE